MALLNGKRIIVTGGGGGIGNAALHLFHREGAKVACTHHSEMPDVPEGVLSEKCDIGSKAEVDAVFDRLCAHLGGLDVLIHAAGIWNTTPAHELSEDQWDEMFRLNGKGTVFTNQAAFRHMHLNGGSIVNMGSVEGVRGTAGNACYSASRGAVMSWTRSLALEWGKHNIRVNSLAPVAHTKLADKAMEASGGTEAEYQAYMRSAIPLGGRMGDPAEDTAPVLLFLASDHSRFVTGQVVPVDGGLMMLGS